MFPYEFLLQVFTVLAVGAATIFLFALGLRLLRAVKPGNPAEQAIFNALEPLAYQAIVAGEMLARQSLNSLEGKLDGLDRRQIAIGLYNALPDNINIGGKLYPISGIKFLIPLETWAAFVERIYQETRANIERNKSYLKTQVETLKPSMPLDRAVG